VKTIIFFCRLLSNTNNTGIQKTKTKLTMLRPKRGTTGGLPTSSSSGAGGGYGYGGGYVGSPSLGVSRCNSDDNGEYKDHKPRRRNNNAGIIGNLMHNVPSSLQPLVDKVLEPWVISLIVAVISFLLMISYRTAYHRILRAMNNSNNANQAIQLFQQIHNDKVRLESKETARLAHDKITQAKITSLEQEKRTIQKERDELRIKHESPTKRNEEIRAVAREEAYKKQLLLLQRSTQRESRRAVHEKYDCSLV
jgi:hypothetical protein